MSASSGAGQEMRGERRHAPSLSLGEAAGQEQSPDLPHVLISLREMKEHLAERDEYNETARSGDQRRA